METNGSSAKMDRRKGAKICNEKVANLEAVFWRKKMSPMMQH
jgi:hypothetical protein